MGSNTRFIFNHYIRPKVQQDRQCACKCNYETHSRNHCRSEKAIIITYSECVFLALGIQHAKRLHRFVYCLPWLVRLCRIFPLEFSGKTFEKSSNIKFHGNPYSWSRVVACGRTNRQTDGHDETNSPSSQFCEGTYKIAQIVKQRIVSSELSILAFPHSFLHRLLWFAYLHVGNDTN